MSNAAGTARETAKSESDPGEISETSPPADSRYISPEVCERVHARAAYQCEYEAPDGTRRPSRTGLEIEHSRPFAIFRTHDERFLKLYCRAHNRLSAERVYGAAFMREKIEASHRHHTSSTRY